MGMFSQPVVFVDIETSGSDIRRSQIIEIAVIRVENEKIVEEYKSLVKPRTNIPQWITNITGIKNNDLEDAPYFEDIAYSLDKILKNAMFIAHNVRFDYSYIKRQMHESGYEFNPKLCCTVRLSRALYPENKGHSLEKIISRHNIKTKARHRAFDDAMAIKTFSEIAYQEKGHDKFEAAVNTQLKSQTLPPNLNESKIKDLTNKPGVYVFEDEDGLPIYVGKSVALRSRVLSHFNQDKNINKEMKISKNTHNIRTIETNNELEALLLESQMIKQELPIYNQKLRRVSSHFVLIKQYNDSGYANITIADKDLSKEINLSNIYGMFNSKIKAKLALENLRRIYQICPKLLGLEKTNSSCFLYQLGKCSGACVGKETVKVHNIRMETALAKLKIENWPYKTAVAIGDDNGNHVVVDKWIVLGYLNNIDQGEPDFKQIDRRFDQDTYRILRSYLSKNMNKLTIKPFNLDMINKYT